MMPAQAFAFVGRIVLTKKVTIFTQLKPLSSDYFSQRFESIYVILLFLGYLSGNSGLHNYTINVKEQQLAWP